MISATDIFLRGGEKMKTCACKIMHNSQDTEILINNYTPQLYLFIFLVLTRKHSRQANYTKTEGSASVAVLAVSSHAKNVGEGDKSHSRSQRGGSHSPTKWWPLCPKTSPSLHLYSPYHTPPPPKVPTMEPLVDGWEQAPQL